MSTDSSQLTGDALDERARELDIEGRSTMTADEKRAAIAEAEAGDGSEGTVTIKRPDLMHEARDADVDDRSDLGAVRDVPFGLESGDDSTSHGPHGFITP